MLDGYATVPELGDRAVKNEQKFLCITDHGMMGAIPNQISVCEKRNLEPIFGIEFYYNPHQVLITNDEERKKHMASLSEEEKKAYRKNYHLLAIATSEVGYKNLVRMATWACLYGVGGRPSRPRINDEIIEKYKKDIIFTSCCYASEIGYTFDTKGSDAAEDVVLKYWARFGNNFRLEIMMLDFHKQKPYDKFIIKMHLKYGIPLYLSQDCHVADPEDTVMQHKMLMMQTGRTIEQVEQMEAEGFDVFEIQDRQLWMKNEEELNVFWENNYQDVIDYEIYKQAKIESLNMAEKAKGVKLDRQLKLPVLPQADDVLFQNIKDGFKKRGLSGSKDHLYRIKEEYELIVRKGFSSYFIIQKMFTDIAREKGPEILGYGDPEDMVSSGRGCLSPTTRVIIQNGKSKPIVDIKVGDKVWSHEGTEGKVTATFKYECNENLLKIKSFYGDAEGVELTKDHKVYAYKKTEGAFDPREITLSWVPAEELKVGDWVYVPPLKEFVDDQAVLPNDPSLIFDIDEDEFVIESCSRDSCDQIRCFYIRNKIPSSIKKVGGGYAVVVPYFFMQEMCFVFPGGGYLTKITSIEEVTGSKYVYDIEVDGFHSFLTTSFIVHNSAVGSLTSYLLGITDVDPLKHGLLFSRFISEDRGRKLDYLMDGEEELSKEPTI